jgi:hypothetical protein
LSYALAQDLTKEQMANHLMEGTRKEGGKEPSKGQRGDFEDEV